MKNLFNRLWNWINLTIFRSKNNPDITEEVTTLKTKTPTVNQEDTSPPVVPTVVENILLNFNEIDSLSLRRVEDNDDLDEDNFTRENLDNNASTILGAGLATGAQVYSFSGLYRATGNVNALMRYQNGTVSSITLNGNKFSTHAGFKEVGGALIPSPMLVFQAASMVTGQYYLQIIQEQITAIQKQLQQLINVHLNEKKAIYENCLYRLQQLMAMKSYEIEDIAIIDTILSDLYKLKLEFLDNFNSQAEVVKQDLQKINKKYNYDNQKSVQRFFNSFKDGFTFQILAGRKSSGKKIQQLIQTDSLLSYGKLANRAELLHQYAKFLQLKIHFNLASRDPGRLERARFLYNDLYIQETIKLHNNITTWNCTVDIADQMDEVYTLLKTEDWWTKTSTYEQMHNSTLKDLETLMAEDSDCKILEEEFQKQKKRLNDDVLIYYDFRNKDNPKVYIK